ncbi:dihydrofolate reductase [Saccharibacillus sp. JS10]|uniref:dihydrofolate reductase n=1 Tax=Saccharibacillus sp. JS10 TaxID=2950552 RepID=UPI00210C634E|nr:dihydrofolate reductase [Saccharibacillus sp. JS10]MCQ4085585.1 dihydrofolate reductase [Saccharibacillus sp. JS10]
MSVITLIWAQDEQELIGKNNTMPWRLPADLAYFKSQTVGKAIVMGRKTWESFGSKPLKDRQNIVLTRNKAFQAEGATVVHSIEEALQMAESEEVMIIGGAEIYALYLPIADQLRVTQVQGTFEGDTFFPSLDKSAWKLVSSEKGIVDEKNKYEHEFQVYERSVN